MLTKHKLDNQQNESLETKELLHFTTRYRQNLLCFPSDAKERWVCRQGNAEVRGSECWKLANEFTGLRVPDSNERACVRPTCEQSTIGWVLRMELSSVMIPQITFGGGRRVSAQFVNETLTLVHLSSLLFWMSLDVVSLPSCGLFHRDTARFD